MTVDRVATAHRSTYGGKTVYFCGAHCKKRFDAEPERFLEGREVAAMAHAGEPGHHGH
jgi:Cu+-exporting ATPase